MKVLNCVLATMWLATSFAGAQQTTFTEPQNSNVGSVSRSGTTKTESQDDELELSQIAQRNAAIEKALKQIGSMDYEETEFIDVMAELHNKLGINVVLDVTAKDDALSNDEPITFKASNLPYETLLSMMLRNHNATYLIRDGILRIISMDVAGDPSFHRHSMLECQNLIRLLIIAEAIEVQEAGPQEAIMKAHAKVTEQRLASDMLEDLVRANVAPDFWLKTNGDGMVKVYGRIMFLSQTEDVTKGVRDFLNDLEVKLQKVVRDE